VAKKKRPTKQQRADLARAILLKRHCEALGVEWDHEVVTEDMELDYPRYYVLQAEMGTVLFTKLGLKIPESVGDFDYTLDSLDRGLTVDDLIDIGRRAGWITADPHLHRPTP
jgi:hypothetical protein